MKDTADVVEQVLYGAIEQERVRSVLWQSGELHPADNVSVVVGTPWGNVPLSIASGLTPAQICDLVFLGLICTED